MTTANAVIGLILGIAGILTIFYNAQAVAAKSVSDVSERVGRIETKNEGYDSDIKDIKDAVKDVPVLVRLVKHAYPNY